MTGSIDLLAGVMTRRRRDSFTLVELLVVIAIGSILALLSLTAYSQIVRSQTIGNCALIVASSMDVARQTAITHNNRVEFRIYQLPDYSAAATAAPTVYRAFQTFLITDNSTNALTPVTLLPAPGVLSMNTAISSIGNIPTSPGSTMTQGSAGASSPQNLPVYQANYNVLAIDFTTSGGLSSAGGLTPNSAWYLTVVLENDPIVLNNLPKNFATIQIDPFSGQTRTYRP